MSAQNHETERLHKRIRQLQIEYEQQEKKKESALRALVEQLEIANKRIIELETKNINNDVE